MHITRDNKLGFVHIQRTGGTSIRNAFLRASLESGGMEYTINDWGIEKNIGVDTREVPEKKYAFRKQMRGPKEIPDFGVLPHPSYKTWEKWASRKEGFTPPKNLFTVVRNPYDRLYSFFMYQKWFDSQYLNRTLPFQSFGTFNCKPRYEIMKDLSFKEFVLNLEELSSKQGIKNLRRTQSEAIDGAPNIKIFKTEKLELVWWWLQSLGYSRIKPLHVNGREDSSIPKFDEETKEAIYNMFIDDFRNFDYNA